MEKRTMVEKQGTNELPSPVIASRSNQRRSFKRPVLILALIIAVYNAFITKNAFHFYSGTRRGKVNVILMISDGYGPASETFGRSFKQALDGYTSPNAHYKTPLDRYLIGSHRSRSSDSLITDSAAGATAFSCALKSYNGAIGVDAKGALCGTVLEGAKEKGMLTGVVVTSRLTDATPASFFAHVPSRAQESDIANEALGLMPNGTAYRDAPLDLMIGGGGCYFLPKSNPLSCRPDDQDLVQVSLEKGWNTKILFTEQADGQISNDYHGQTHSSSTMASFNETAFDQFSIKYSKETLPLLALLAPFNTPYEIDRKRGSPALHTLALKALDVLDRSHKNDKGFFLMIEGSQIDLCAHSNDPACHAREIGAYQTAIEKVGDWVEKKNRAGNDDRTILISTSDHETGGLTLGRQLTATYPNYAYYPQRLIPVRQSAASLSAHLLAFARTSPAPTLEQIRDYVQHETLGEGGAAFLSTNGGEASDEEIQHVMDCLAQTPLTPPPINTADVCRTVIAALISRRAEMGWSTSGHTGVDVPVHALGPDIEALKGNIENTEIGSFIAKELNIDLRDLTRKLQERRAEQG